jgi:hypothetical protein
MSANIDFTPDYIAATCSLLEHGEERLLCGACSTAKKTARYQRIVASIAAVGIVEPLVVARRDGRGPTCWSTAT